ncbi:MAG TPA: hypothetical protein DIW61_17180 [Candidatus Aminicenantes bacterium]|nr:hypothetical protein [Candidatus Aminicenantes bacterium]
MTRQNSRIVLAAALFLLAASLFFPPLSTAQEKADAQKIYADVAGTYEFTLEGQSLILIFFVKDGRLYGKEQMDPEDVEIKPLDLEKLKFEATVQSNGNYYEIGFVRDEGGKVNKCHLSSAGTELDGARVN